MARSRHYEKEYKEGISDAEDFKRSFSATEVSAGITREFNQYMEWEKMKEYLVDGAMLQCSKSTLKPFKVSGMPEIRLTNETEGSQEERERTRLYVRKVDGKMTVDKSFYATVLDCKKGELSRQKIEESDDDGANIYPFRCNCQVEVDRVEEKDLIIEHIDECKKNGVCQYLMDLNDTWNNWLSDHGRFYEKRLVKVPIETKDGKKSFSIDAECISMTSMLFCKHGGLITPVDSGQVRRIVEEVFFTTEELRTCGWKTITTEEALKFNLALLDFGVTTRFSACMLLATMLAESEYCLYTIEGEYQAEYDLDTQEGWNAFQISKNKTYKYNFTKRGAGYIQITFADTHSAFLDAMKDTFQEENTARYIANNYPIEASVWYWTSFDKTRVGNLNDFVDMKYSGDSKKQDDVFLAVQYYVNGFQGTKDYIQDIENGNYEIQAGDKVIIKGVSDSFNVPSRWADRVECWNKVRRLL